MKGVACFLGLLALSGGCVLEDTPVDDAGVDGSVCGAPCADQNPEKPVCDETKAQCVECTAEADTYCTEQGLLCDVENSDCVTCLLDTDCTAIEAAKCDLSMDKCVPCETNEQCSDVMGLPGENNACNTQHICVQCTPGTEATSCAGKSCDPEKEICTETDVGSLDVCEECVADSECGDDGVPSDAFRCVPMYYDGNRFPDEDTGFCLKTTVGGCQQPYSITLADRPSLSEPTTETNYCGINENLATCPAVNALLGNQQCPNGTAAECPQPGGLCERVGDLENRCTYRCGLPAQCPADAPADTCGSSGSGGDDYCGG